MATNAAWKPSTPPGHQHGRHRGDARGTADLAHRLDQARRQSRLRLCDAGQRADLQRGHAEPEAEAGEQECRKQVGEVTGVRGTCVSHSIPTASSDRPITSSRRTPTAATIRPGGGRDEDGHRRRQPGHAGLCRRVTEFLLHQQRSEEDEREERAEGEERRDVRRYQRAVPQRSGGHEWCGERASIRTNAAISRGRRTNQQRG